VYADGRPLLIDIGVETYTAKTFSSSRYDIWTMQSQYHNLPTINGIQQKEGREYHAENARFSASGKQVKFTLDLAKAYPAEAMVKSWNRSIVLDRGSKLTLTEKYELQSWKEALKLNAMTAFKADLSVPGYILLTDRQDPTRVYEITYDPKKFGVVAENKEITDKRLLAVWGNSLIRLVFTAKDKSLTGQYQIVVKKRRPQV
jgi:hypothetical protein